MLPSQIIIFKLRLNIYFKELRYEESITAEFNNYYNSS